MRNMKTVSEEEMYSVAGGSDLNELWDLVVRVGKIFKDIFTRPIVCCGTLRFF